MSNIKELIRQNIDAYYAEYKDKFHQNGDPYHLGIIDGLDIAERILDTLEEPVTDCHDLEEAAEAYSRQVSRGHNYRDLTCGFKAGAEWMKRKMTEGAVEGVVYRYESYQKIATAIIVDVPKESLDNKVRIIIVKEEEQ